MTTAGLCATCRHCRLVQTGRSTFYLCERSLTDPHYRKYPVIPVLACPGYEAAGRECREPPPQPDRER